MLPMIQKTAARSTDLNVIVGSVGSSSKLTTFRTRSGMLENSSESKSYCGSSSNVVCSFGVLLSSSSASLNVTLDMAGVFSFAVVAILLTNVRDLIKTTRRKCRRFLRAKSSGPREAAHYKLYHSRSHPSTGGSNPPRKTSLPIFRPATLVHTLWHPISYPATCNSGPE